MPIWSARRDDFLAVAAALDAAGAPASDRVMSIDASGTRYWTGHGGVVLVNDPLDTIHDVATAYDIRWLVLDRERRGPVRRAHPRRHGRTRPGSASRSSPRAARLALAVYPVLATP